jgi:HAD superfamily hydrolase (TIGR01509 family)
VVSGDVGIHKPDPHIFELCLSKMRLDPTQAVYVGDHYENDVRGAQAVGLSAIWYAGAVRKADVPVAARLRDILKYI